MFFRLLSVTLILALVALGTPVKRDSATVESDIKAVVERVGELNNALDMLPQYPTFAQVFDIHNYAVGLVDDFQFTTTSTNACPEFTEEQAGDISKLLDSVVPMIQTGCETLVEKKSAITYAGALEIAQGDLSNLDKAAGPLEQALLLKFSANWQSSVQLSLNNMQAALASAMKAYGV